MVKIYDTLPDHGDRFARMWEAYHTRKPSRLSALAIVMIGCVAGLFLAAVL